jgi:cyanophycinase
MGSIDLLERDCGPLLIVGGAEDKTGPCAILRELVRLAGGASARIVVLTAASEFPREVGAMYVDVLTRLGAGHVEPVHVRTRGEADHPEVLQAIERASAAFFTGGIQSRITDSIRGSRLHAALARRWRAGLVVGGTSAGAAVMSDLMIVGSARPADACTDDVVIGSGLGFTPDVIVDQHFSQRLRLGRLMAAVTRHPDHVGLGIDEDTAIVVRGCTFDVIGTGTVTLVDGRLARRSAFLAPPGNDVIVVRAARLDLLIPGQRARFRMVPSAAPRQPIFTRPEGRPR